VALVILRCLLTASFRNRWVLLRMVACTGVLAYFLNLLVRNIQIVWQKTKSGWYSHVLLKKFELVLLHALKLKKRLELHQHQQQSLEADDGSSAVLLQELQQACAGVVDPATQLVRGLSGGCGHLALVEGVFGESLSWRWLVPLRPGGSGDSLKDICFDEDACAAWATLAVVLSRHEQIERRQAEARVAAQTEAEAKQRRQIEAWLANSGK